MRLAPNLPTSADALKNKSTPTEALNYWQFFDRISSKSSWRSKKVVNLLVPVCIAACNSGKELSKFALCSHSRHPVDAMNATTEIERLEFPALQPMSTYRTAA